MIGTCCIDKMLWSRTPLTATLHEEADMADPLRLPPTPRWVKRSGLAVGVLIVLAVVMMLAGGGRHGPGRHMPADDTSGSRQWGGGLQ